MSAVTSSTAPTDVVEGARDVVCHGPMLLADPPADPADTRPAAGRGPCPNSSRTPEPVEGGHSGRASHHHHHRRHRRPRCDPRRVSRQHRSTPATLTDHKCQVTRAEITATSASTTTDRIATFCAPAATVQVPDASTFGLALEGFQDWTATAGISAWLFKNDATEQAFALYLDGETEDPSAVGVVVVVAGAFAGSPQVPLTFAVELPIQGYPTIKDSAGASIRSGV